MEDVSKAGFTRVKSALARTIAHSANVSVLRLSNLMVIINILTMILLKYCNSNYARHSNVKTN